MAYTKTPLKPDTWRIQRICEYFHELAHDPQGKQYHYPYTIDIDRIRGKIRKQHIVNARIIVAYYLHRCCNWPVKMVGYWMNKDHSTIVHYMELYRDYVEQGNDPQLAEASHETAYLLRTPEDTNVDAFLREYGLSFDDYKRKTSEPLMDEPIKIKKRIAYHRRKIAYFKTLLEAVA